jgi:hypothetical protein
MTTPLPSLPTLPLVLMHTVRPAGWWRKRCIYIVHIISAHFLVRLFLLLGFFSVTVLVGSQISERKSWPLTDLANSNDVIYRSSGFPPR